MAFRGSLVDPGADVVVDSFFDQLFARSTLIVALRDVNGRFVRVSRRLARLFAAVGTDPVGRTVFDVLPADMANLVYYHDQQALSSRRYAEYVEEFVAGDVRRVYHTALLPLVDHHGAVKALVSISTDITARRRTEEALRNAALAVSGAMRSEVFDQLVRYLATTLRVDFAFVSRLDRQDPTRSTIVAGATRGRMFHDFHYTLSGTPCENVFVKSFEFVPRDLPQRFPSDRLMIDQGLESYAAYPLYDSDARPIGLIGIAHSRPLANRPLIEATLRIYSTRAAAELERQRAEQELRVSEANYREIFENAEEAILVHEPDTRAILDANPRACETYGLTLEEMKRTDFCSLSFTEPPISREEADRLIARARGGEKVRLETCRLDGEGRARYDEVVISRAVLAGKERVLVHCRDVTERHEAEERLRASEEQYRAIFNASVDGVTLWDARGRLVDVNPAITAMYGYSREELLSLDPREVVHPDQRDEFDAFVERVKAGEEFHFEALNQRRDGSAIEVEVDGVPMDYQGRAHMLVFFREITERKQREERLRASEEQYRAIFNASADGMILYDDTGRMVDVNPAMEQMFGYSREELLSLDPHVRFHPSAWPVIDRFLERLRSGWFFRPERPDRPEIEETREVTRDGRILEFEAHLLGMRYQGRPHVLAIKRDITDRKQREAALKKSEDRLRATVESALDCIIIMDAEGRIIEFNPAAERCFGHSREAVIGRDLVETLIPAASRRRHERDMARYRKTGRGSFLGRRREVTAMRADGSEFPAELAITAVKGPDGDIFVGYLRDISDRVGAEADRERLEQQLRQAQKMEAIGHLTGGIAHDFNNMLTSILGYTTMALERLEDVPDERLEKYMQQVRASGKRARDLIRQMLTFSRGRRGEPKPTSVPRAVRESIDLFRSSFPSSITFRIEAEETAPLVMIDPIQFEQVLMNLCINARDAMPGWGEIEIGIAARHCDDAVCASCRQDITGEFVELSVADTGSGIRPEVMDSMFQPFFTTKEVGQGSGMGLSTTHGIVHEHSGHILVANRPAGGARFAILLPPVAATRGNSDRVDRPDKRRREPLSGRVLVVDDEAPVREFVRELLQTRGMDVTAVADGFDALDLVANEPDTCDLVITDQTMPSISGIELAYRLKAARPGLPVILISGFSDRVTGRGPEELGVDAVFSKPLDHHDLLAKVRELLDARRTG